MKKTRRIKGLRETSRPRAGGHSLERVLRDDTWGLSTVEYIIILCLIAVVCFATWKLFGDTIEFHVRAAARIFGLLPTGI